MMRGLFRIVRSLEPGCTVLHESTSDQRLNEETLRTASIYKITSERAEKGEFLECRPGEVEGGR